MTTTPSQSKPVRPSLLRLALISLGTALLGGIVASSTQAQTGPDGVYRIQMTVNFIDKLDEPRRPRVKHFRRYGIGQTGFPNVMDLHCTHDAGTVSQMVFRIPADYPLKSFPRTSQGITVPLSIQIDNGRLFRFTGTYYRDGEIFIDRDPPVRSAFDEVLSANSMKLVFGAQNDTIEYVLDVRVDAVMSSLIVNPQFSRELGSFQQMHPTSVIDRCLEISPTGERLDLAQRTAPVRCEIEPQRGIVCRVANRQFVYCRAQSDLPAFETEMKYSHPERLREVVNRYASKRCGVTDAIIMNDVATPENIWEGGVLHPAVSKEVFTLPIPAVLPVQTAPAPQTTAPATAAANDSPPRMPDANLIAYGTRAGMNLTIVEKIGIGTASARIRVIHTEANAKAYCVEYLDDTSASCIRQTMQRVRPRPELTANCRTGGFTDAFGNRYQFRGRSRSGSPEFRIFDVQRREELDGSGYYTVMEQYTALCGVPR